HPDAFGIVSSDADFTPLVMHLRAKGAQVYGFGDTKTPEAFQSACTKFLLLDQMTEQDEDGSSAGARTAAAKTARSSAKRSTAKTTAKATSAAKKGAAP